MAYGVPVIAYMKSTNYPMSYDNNMPPLKNNLEEILLTKLIRDANFFKIKS